MDKKFLPPRVWIVGFLLIAGLGLAFYLIMGRNTQTTTAQQLLKRGQTIARAESSNIISFFHVFGESIAAVSRFSSVERRDTQTIKDMNVFVEEWRDSGLIGGIVLTDKEGVVRFNSNILGTSDTGVSLSDRDYFQWTKNNAEAGDYFVGSPVVSRLGGTKGQTIVPVAVPVYQNGIFVGVFAASVRLHPLTERYLGLMEVSETTDVFLVDTNGKLLYSPKSYAENSNISEIFNSNIKDILSTYQEGSSQTSYLNPSSGKKEEYLIAYSPVSLSNQKWLIILSSPIENLRSAVTPIYIRQIAILILASLTTILFGIIIAREKVKIVISANNENQKSL